MRLRLVDFPRAYIAGAEPNPVEKTLPGPKAERPGVPFRDTEIFFLTACLECDYRRRPAEHRKVPVRIVAVFADSRQSALDQYHLHRLQAHQRRQCRVHRNAERAAFFSARKLRRIRSRTHLRLLVRQPLAMGVRHLRGTRNRHQQQAGERQRPQPYRIRRVGRSALQSIRQRVSGLQLM